ncbi:MAG: sensor histidine kinase [Phaeodactylibacter sp.]|nr:sensor histidine kinase [Phaeodactylibacter sp.]MCB9304084.1 sensor histidine kinase [Lewinellaceae bacterium]
MFKNPTPQQIALFVAFYITAFTLGVWVLVEMARDREMLTWTTTLILLGVVSFAIAYLITIFYLRKYIYRKIKVIYKTIHKQKLSPQEKNKTIDVRANIIDEVEKQVSEWADQQQEEIERYKAWAEYRRNFVGDISHELKTPIFNIQGYLHTLLDGAINDEAVNLKFLSKAAKNLERLHTIVEDLEAISRLESGELILEMQSFDIKKLCEEVFEDLEIKAAQRNITLEFKEGAAHNYRVQADRESIRQVMTNLLYNSIKYGVENGRTRVGFYDMDKNILVEVADNGIGIPKKHLDHVFDRFYRVDKSRSREAGGSGLGLSIVKHIIEAHKQAINVRSTPELGSTFGFTLQKA